MSECLGIRTLLRLHAVLGTIPHHGPVAFLTRAVDPTKRMVAQP